ncbi:MAG: type II toxin-antitoxin system RelE/ParE family toxin [Silvibacterium sp.]
MCYHINVIAVREYLDERGRSPFADWFNGLNAPAAARITTALLRVEMGNFSNAKGVGAGVYEYRIDFGPGYRIYFGKDGDRLVILLGGGSKKRQQRDIAEAIALWSEYKRGNRTKGKGAQCHSHATSKKQS